MVFDWNRFFEHLESPAFAIHIERGHKEKPKTKLVRNVRGLIK